MNFNDVIQNAVIMYLLNQKLSKIQLLSCRGHGNFFGVKKVGNLWSKYPPKALTAAILHSYTGEGALGH